MNADLRTAIFWEQMAMWSLNRLEAFTPGVAGQQRWSIDFAQAIMANEMNLLGDRMIGTVAPLRFSVRLDPTRSEPIPTEGPHTDTIAGVSTLSHNKVLTGRAANLA